MADEQSSATNADELPAESWRTLFALSAAAEVCDIATALQLDHNPAPDLLRGFAIRLEHLASVVMSSLGDELALEASVDELLHGVAAHRRRMAAGT